MKKLLFITLLLTSIGVRAQLSQYSVIPDSIRAITPDTVWCGDSITFKVYYHWYSDYPSSTNDTLVFTIQSQYLGYGGGVAYKHAGWSLPNQLVEINGGVDSFKVQMPTLGIDSIYFKVIIFATDNLSHNTTNSEFVARKSTVGINELYGTNTHTISKIRYYNVLGQLYGEYIKEQTDLPHSPLIEEIEYTDKTVAIRTILHLK